MKKLIVIYLSVFLMGHIGYANTGVENSKVTQSDKQEFEEHWYVGLGVLGTRYDTGCNCPQKGGTDNTFGFLVRIGADFNEYLGLEGRGLVSGISSSDSKVKHLGLFLKPMHQASDKVNLYALLGYADTQVTGNLRNVDAQAFAWGFGFEYDFKKDIARSFKYNRNFDGQADQEQGWGLFVDYERLIQKSGSPDLDTLSVGVTYDF